MPINRRDLMELYERSTTVEIPNPKDSDNPIVLYLRKMNPLEHQQALRAANAARIVALQRGNLPEDHEDRVLLEAEIDELGDRDDQIEYLAAFEIAGQHDAMESELAEEEEWSKEGYLQSLFDAWEDGLSELYVVEKDRTEESEQVFKELKRFSDILEKLSAKRRMGIEKNLEMETDLVLRGKIRKGILDRESSVEWMTTFRAYQFMYGVVDDEGNRLFDESEQVLELPMEVYQKLMDGINTINLTPQEVKS